MAFEKERIAVVRHLVPLMIAFEDEALPGNEMTVVPLLDLLDELPVVRAALWTESITRNGVSHQRHAPFGRRRSAAISAN